MVDKGYCFRLKVDDTLRRRSVAVFGCCRFVWNKALALNLHRLVGHLPIMRYTVLCGLRVLWKRSVEAGFLAAAPAVSRESWNLRGWAPIPFR
jgi:putative transposase